MKHLISILILTILFSSASYGEVEELKGKSYDNIKKDFPDYDSVSSSCLLNCNYVIDNVRYKNGKDISIFLAKKGVSVHKWKIVDVLEGIRRVGDRHYTLTQNCTKSYSSFKNKITDSSEVMPMDDNIVAIVHVTGKEKAKEESWVNATKAFTINIESHRFNEIPTEDVYCYVGLG